MIDETQTPVEDPNEVVYDKEGRGPEDPYFNDPFVTEAGNSSRRVTPDMPVVELTDVQATAEQKNPPKNPGGNAFGKFVRKHPVAAGLTLTGAAIVGIPAANTAFGDPAGTIAENINHEDVIIDSELAIDEGYGPKAAAEQTADYLVLENKIDPALVNFGSLRDVVAGVPSGQNGFEIALVDEGRTYKFELKPTGISGNVLQGENGATPPDTSDKFPDPLPLDTSPNTIPSPGQQ